MRLQPGSGRCNCIRQLQELKSWLNKKSLKEGLGPGIEISARCDWDAPSCLVFCLNNSQFTKHIRISFCVFSNIQPLLFTQVFVQSLLISGLLWHCSPSASKPLQLIQDAAAWLVFNLFVPMFPQRASWRLGPHQISSQNRTPPTWRPLFKPHTALDFLQATSATRLNSTWLTLTPELPQNHGMSLNIQQNSANKKESKTWQCPLC